MFGTGQDWNNAVGLGFSRVGSIGGAALSAGGVWG